MRNFFAHPEALWLLAVLPVVTGLWLWSRRRQVVGLKKLGLPTAIAGLIQRRPQARRWQQVFLSLGLLVLVLACAGPRWGRDPRPPAVGGRDLVIVLDLSRSMLAEQPSRQERALRALRDLADTLEQRGGHRVALVIFAAQPQLVFPLTPDYDHFRAALAQVDANDRPPQLRPAAGGGTPSGTRIGAALELAVQTHEPRFQGAQDILLLSDGDDPGDDDEWTAGAAAARRQGIPVQTIGIGDPARPSPIPAPPGEQGFLRYQDQQVSSRLQERPLRAIADRTEGVYIPAHTLVLPLGRVFRETLEPRGRRQSGDLPDTAALPVYQQRASWFLALALGFLSLTMVVADGLGRPVHSAALPPSPGKGNKKVLLASLLALAALAAAPLPPVLQLLRQGNAAYEQEQYEAALHQYRLAEPAAADPGLVAFNKAAALYRLGRYREAELHYRRCLDDQLIPRPRQARACYDLGNCLLQQGPLDNASLLEEAIASYRITIDLEEQPSPLRADAEYNLELARLLWLKARPETKQTPDKEPSLHPQPEEKKNGKTPGKGSANTGQPGQKEDPNPNTASNGQAQQPGVNQKKKVTPGPLQVLPDADRLVPLSPEDTSDLLKQAAERILAERRQFRRQAGEVSPMTKDW